MIIDAPNIYFGIDTAIELYDQKRSIIKIDTQYALLFGRGALDQWLAYTMGAEHKESTEAAHRLLLIEGLTTRVLLNVGKERYTTIYKLSMN